MDGRHAKARVLCSLTYLTIAALISSLAYISTLGSNEGADRLHYVLKPLTTLLIAGIAFVIPVPVSDTYRWLVILGLLLSLAGDVFLTLPDDRYFIFGLAAFLVAHLFYIGAYRCAAGLALPGGWHCCTWPMQSHSCTCFGPASPTYAFRYSVYAAVLMVMGWQAAEMWLIWSDISALAAMLGGVFFLLSDSTLALNRFRAPIRQSSIIVMSTYWAAQLLIAWSVRA